MSEDRPEELEIDGSDLQVAIVASRFNQRFVDELLRNCLEALRQCGVSEEEISVVRVPGSNEIPYAASMMAGSNNFDVVIGLGLLLAGETSHLSIVADCTAHALQRIAVDSRIPVINGIVVVNTLEQAEARCFGKVNRGREFGLAAVEMGLVGCSLTAELDDEVGFDSDTGKF